MIGVAQGNEHSDDADWERQLGGGYAALNTGEDADDELSGLVNDRSLDCSSQMTETDEHHQHDPTHQGHRDQTCGKRLCSWRVWLSMLLLCLSVLLLLIILFMLDSIQQTNTTMILFNHFKDKLWRVRFRKRDDFRSQSIQNTVSKWCHQFNNRNQSYTLDFGTLLGAMRMGNAIPWDHDCDFSLIHYDHFIHHSNNYDNQTTMPIMKKSLVYYRDYGNDNNQNNQKQRDDAVTHCDVFERRFSEQDLHSEHRRLCTHDFEGDSDWYNAFSNNLNRKIPCIWMSETMPLGVLFPDSPWSHCSISKYSRQILDYYYGKNWDKDWQNDYRTLGFEV